MNTDQYGKPVNSADAFELLTRTCDDSSSELLLSDSLRYRVRCFLFNLYFHINSFCPTVILVYM